MLDQHSNAEGQSMLDCLPGRWLLLVTIHAGTMQGMHERSGVRCYYAVHSDIQYQYIVCHVLLALAAASGLPHPAIGPGRYAIPGYQVLGGQRRPFCGCKRSIGECIAAWSCFKATLLFATLHAFPNTQQEYCSDVTFLNMNVYCSCASHSCFSILFASN
jgi:hypothetical protein